MGNRFFKYWRSLRHGRILTGQRELMSSRGWTPLLVARRVAPHRGKTGVAAAVEVTEGERTASRPDPNRTIAAMMSDYQRETEFLRQCIRYDDTAEHLKLGERIAELHRIELGVRRAMWLMALFAGLALAGLCYGAVFLAEYPLDLVQFHARLLVKVPCALGAGSLTCLLVFASFGAINRRELDRRREDCRRLTTKLMEARLGKPLAVRGPVGAAAGQDGAMDPLPSAS